MIEDSRRNKSRSRGAGADPPPPEPVKPAPQPSGRSRGRATPPAASPAAAPADKGSVLSALQSEWGDEHSLAHAPLNLTTVSQQLGKWLEGVSLPQLADNIEQMRSRVHSLALGMKKELARPLDPELANFYRTNHREFSTAEKCLAELGQGVTQGKTEAVRQHLTRMRAANRSLLANQKALRQWLALPVARCPRCGRAGSEQDWTCSNCDMELLYRAEKPRSLASGPPVDLPPEFQAVHQAYAAVVRGDLSLLKLGATLGPLRKLLQTQADLFRARPQVSEDVAAMLEAIGAAVRRGLQGIAVLEVVPKTRRVQDLHEGWRQLYQCAAELQEQLPPLARAAGVDLPEEKPRPADTVHLRGE